MANIDTGGDAAEKGKPKKETLRVDFTPMVDMNMLLITFFMFVTTLSKPQVMEIAMPSDSNYKNLVDALDEMQICSVGKYAIVDVTEGDLFLVENYKSKGAYGAANLAPR